MTKLRRHPVFVFLVLTFALAWGLDAVRMVMRPAPLVEGVFWIIIGASPSVSAVILACAVGGVAGLRALLSPLVRWRVGIRWWLLVLVALPALILGVSAVTLMASGQEFGSALPGPLWLVPVFLPLVVFAGPLQEELGWRAFALPRLLDHQSWVRAGLLLGAVWALWHRMPSTWSDIAWNDPLAPSGALGLVLGAVVPDIALSVLMAWIFVRTGGSALVAGLGVHTAVNFALLVPQAPVGETATTASWVLTAAIAGLLSLLTIAAVVVERRRLGAVADPATSR